MANDFSDKGVFIEVDLMPSTKTVTLKVPVELIAKMDEVYKQLNYANRSELIRAAIQEFLKHINETKRKA